MLSTELEEKTAIEAENTEVSLNTWDIIEVNLQEDELNSPPTSEEMNGLGVGVLTIVGAGP